MVETQEATAVFMVVIEWAGKKPPSTFYNRLHEYGLYSRAPKDTELGVLQWRSNRGGKRKSSSKHGIILQEGLIAVSSMTLAKDIAAWAQDLGAEVVQVGHMVVSEFQMSDKDQSAFFDLKHAVEKRGPKSKADAGTYTITCLDEVMSYTIETESKPMVCGKCGGSNILSRLGSLPNYQRYDRQYDDELFSYWKRTRFAGGQFEIPRLLTSSSKIIYPSPKVLTIRNIDLPHLQLPEELIDKMDSSIDLAYHIWDVAWCVSRHSFTRRLDERLAVIASYAKQGGETYYSFNPEEGSLDILDMAICDLTLLEYA